MLGISVFVATFLVVGTGSKPVELAVAPTDPSLLDAMLRSECNMLCLLIALCVVNVLFAVWRPKMMFKIR